MDLGQMRRGVDMGPSAIRYAGIVERLERLNYSNESYTIKSYFSLQYSALVFFPYIVFSHY